MRSTFLCFAVLLLTACGLAMSDEDRLDRGEEALASGDFRAAIIDAKDVLRDEPENARGRVLLGRASVAIGDGASAEKELRRAVELGVPYEDVIVYLARGLLQQRKLQEIVDEVQPQAAATPDDKAELRLIRADAFMGLRQPAAATELYNEVLAAEPNNIGALLGIASSFRAEDNTAEARRTLDHVTSNSPDDIRGWLASGELHFGMRNYERASQDYETARKLAVGSEDIAAEVRALSGLAEAYLALEKVDDARESALRVAELAPETLQALFLMSRIAYMDEDWATAQQNLQRILTANPDYSPARTLLGAVHLKNGNLSQAEMYLSAVLAANPDDKQARRLLAGTRLQMQDLEGAEATLEPLVSSDEPDVAAIAMAARASLGRGDLDLAIDLLRRAVEEDPSNVDLRFQLAIALMNAGRSDELTQVLDGMDVSRSPQDEFRRDLLTAMSAAQSSGLEQGLLAAEQLVKDWPRNPNAHNLLGSILLARDDLESASVSFERSIELQPGEQTAQRNLATIEEKQGNLGAAQIRYELALESHPDATWAMLGLARLAASDEDLDKSQEWLQRIRSVDANALFPRATLARMLLADRKFDEAEQVLDEAMRIKGDIPELHSLLGHSRSGQDDHAGASMAYKTALELAPDNDQYRLNLANAQRRTGNEILAEETLLENGTVNLDHIPTAVLVASLKVESGDLGEAMRIAVALRQRHPESPIPLALEGEIHVRSGRLEDAEMAYDRALEIDVMRSHVLRAHRIKNELDRADRNDPLLAWLAIQPQDNNVRMVLAESLQKSNRLDEAIGEYETILEQDSGNGVALNNLAWTYYSAGDDRAVDTARKAASFIPDNGAVADTLGWILVETGNVREGVDILQRAVELSNGRAEIRYHYAAGLARSGRVDEAREILQDVVSSDAVFSGRTDAERLLADL